MDWQLQLTETMYGWLAYDGRAPRKVALHLTATAPLLVWPTRPRPFKGEINFTETGECYLVEGHLRLLPTGPEYDFSFIPDDGRTLRCTGRKTYRLRRLIHSVITCPVSLYRGDTIIGNGELQYRDPLWQFPLKALRLHRDEQTGRLKPSHGVRHG